MMMSRPRRASQPVQNSKKFQLIPENARYMRAFLDVLRVSN